MLIDEMKKMEGVRIAIVGDVGLDEYVSGEVKRISPEAPVPVLSANHEDRKLGLSGNVAQNVKSLGGEPVFLSVVGDDETAAQVADLLESEGVSASGLVRDSGRPTTRKLRVLTGHHHIVRVDFEKRGFLPESIEDQLLKRLEEELPNCAGLILQDYSKGVLSERLTQASIAMAKKMKKPVLVDPHRSTPVSYYRGASLFKPNYDEAVILSQYQSDAIEQPDDVVAEISQRLIEKGGFENLVMTRGSQGMSIFGSQGREDIPTAAKEVFDVTGAGDTVIAALALAWCGGASLSSACQLANHAAGIVVSHVGCVPCGRDELLNQLD